MKIVTLAALGSIFISLPAHASTDCDKAEDQSTMTKCASDALAKVDKQLNENYKKIEKRLTDDEETKKLLVSSQRLWMKFRDAECNFATSTTSGGSIHPMMVATCRAQLTTARNKQLSDYLNCEEGDLTCPVPSAD